MTFVRLAMNPKSRATDIAALGRASEPPNILVSYAFYDGWQKHHQHYRYASCMMDSGGFSAWNSGATIDLDRYCDDALKEIDAGRVQEVIALDVIGDWREGEKNFERMWKRGVPAIPVYHYGEPVEFLDHIRKAFPWKLCVGGAAGLRNPRAKRAQACSILKRAWPVRAHGLGFGSDGDVDAAPFHSVDAASWRVGPGKYGIWKSIGRVPYRLSSTNAHVLVGEIEHYLRMQRRARSRWASQLAEVEAALPKWPIARMP